MTDGTAPDPAATAAALLAAFPAGVLVCTADGRVARANAAAARLLGRTAPGDLAGCAAAALVDAHLLRDALDRLAAAPGAADERRPVFLTGGPRTGRRVEVVPLADGGFLLVLEAVRDAAAPDRATDRFLVQVTEGIRAPLAGIRAAAETMVEYPGMEAAVADQFRRIVLEQAVQLSDHLTATVAAYSDALKARSPLEVMSVADLLAGLQARLQQTLPVPVRVEAPAAPGAVRVDAYVLLHGLEQLAGLVYHAVRCEALSVRAAFDDGFARLDLAWAGPRVRLERLRKWEAQPLDFDGSVLAMTLREVVERHRAEIWTQAEGGEACVRLLLPLA